MVRPTAHPGIHNHPPSVSQMIRRDFIRAGALGAGATLLIGPTACAMQQQDTPSREGGESLPEPIARLRSRADEAPPPIGKAEQAQRRARAQELMGQQGIDALFYEGGPSLMYTTGIRWGRSERTFGVLLPRRGDPVIISPAFEAKRAASVGADAFEIREWREHESPFKLIADTLRERGTATGVVAVDESARYFIPRGIAAAAPALRVVDASPLTQQLRGRKSPAEVAIMRFANELTLQAYEAAFETLEPGLTQGQFSRTISQAISRLGYSGGAMALFGESSAYPHGLDVPTPLEEGQVVLVDGGLSVHGYQSDISRTVVLGRPSDEVRKVFEVVHQAQAAALAATVPGRPCGDVDAAARKVVTDAGYGPDDTLFTHRLGHGIGMEGHEWPYLVAGSQVELQPGMSFSNEPGIYQYGKFGVRLEDIMVVTDDGAELLTPQAALLA